MVEESAAPATLLLCRDLMFVSKVTATGRAVGVAVKVVRDPAQLQAEGKRLLVDLGQEGALEAAMGWRTRTGGKVVGFVAHVDADMIARARAVGLDRVMTRGQFTAGLDGILGE